MNCNTPTITLSLPKTPRASDGTRTPSSVLKAIIVDALGYVLAWHPSLAMRLGKLVTRVWRGFRRA